MLKSEDIRRQAAQRLREVFPAATGWEETPEARIGNQNADLIVKFKLGEQEQTLVIEVCSLGQPRQIRAAVTRLREIRREIEHAYPVAAAVYIGPQSARILKTNGLGYIDLSGNCSLAFGHVLIDKEGKRNVRPSTRPLRSLFAPRATRVVRVLLTDPARAWRLEELAKAAGVSLGHSHNVVKRLADLAWVERDDRQRIRLMKPADLLEAWCDSYTYRESEITSYVVSGRAALRLHPERGPVAGRAPSAHAGDPQLPGGRSGAGGDGARVTSGHRDGGRAAPARALRPRSLLRRAGEGRAQGHLAAPALRRPRELRAPRPRAGRAPAARGDGLLRPRDRSEIPNERG